MSLEFRSGHGGTEAQLTDLFRETFTNSEGADEGRVIGAFVSALLNDGPQKDLRTFTAFEGNERIGAIIFSRLNYENDDRLVFILSPVAVRPNKQRSGCGQALINHGLKALRGEGADYAVTYGDPAYYSKTGFQPVSQDTVPPPLPLSMPQGWLGQAFSQSGTTAFHGTPRCIPALNDPDLW